MAQQQYTLSGQVSVTVELEKLFKCAILFDYISDETSTNEAVITDNFVESNYAVQDHIAIRPRTYRLRGYIGEVVYKAPSKTLNWIEEEAKTNIVLQKTLKAVKPITALSGIVSNYTQSAINVANQIESSINRYVDIWQNFKEKKQFLGKRQKYVYTALKTMLENRLPVELDGLMFDKNVFVGVTKDGQTKENYKRVYFLQSVTAHQGDNAFISDIEVVIKEIRVAQTALTEVDTSKFGGLVIQTQKTEFANNGVAKSEEIRNAEESIRQHDKPFGENKNFIQKFANFGNMMDNISIY